MRSALAAVLAQRCPRCREGRIFRTLLRMHDACPECGADLEREQGYFLGAMYFSYGFAVVAVLVPVTWMIIARIDPVLIGAVAGALLLPLAPLLFRYSRVVWLHFDHTFDPLPDHEGRKRHA